MLPAESPRGFVRPGGARHQLRTDINRQKRLLSALLEGGREGERDREVLCAPGHDEQLPDHAGALANVLLDKLAARHTDEGAIRVMCHGASEESLACAGRPVEQHSLTDTTPRVERNEKENGGKAVHVNAPVERCWHG